VIQNRLLEGDIFYIFISYYNPFLLIEIGISLTKYYLFAQNNEPINSIKELIFAKVIKYDNS